VWGMVSKVSVGGLLWTVLQLLQLSERHTDECCHAACKHPWTPFHCFCIIVGLRFCFRNLQYVLLVFYGSHLQEICHCDDMHVPEHSLAFPANSSTWNSLGFWFQADLCKKIITHWLWHSFCDKSPSASKNWTTPFIFGVVYDSTQAAMLKQWHHVYLFSLTLVPTITHGLQVTHKQEKQLVVWRHVIK